MSYKVQFGADIRRFFLEPNSYGALREKLVALFSVQEPLIAWRDEEGDQVTIVSDEDLRTAFASLSNTRQPLRVFVSERAAEEDSDDLVVVSNTPAPTSPAVTVASAHAAALQTAAVASAHAAALQTAAVAERTTEPDTEPAAANPATPATPAPTSRFFDLGPTLTGLAAPATIHEEEHTEAHGVVAAALVPTSPHPEPQPQPSPEALPSPSPSPARVPASSVPTLMQLNAEAVEAFLAARRALGQPEVFMLPPAATPEATPAPVPTHPAAEPTPRAEEPATVQGSTAPSDAPADAAPADAALAMPAFPVPRAAEPTSPLETTYQTFAAIARTFRDEIERLVEAVATISLSKPHPARHHHRGAHRHAAAPVPAEAVEPATAAAEEPVVHEGLICDVCEAPIVGRRFKCCVCPDYDLCMRCEATGAHADHPMVRLCRPGSQSRRHAYHPFAHAHHFARRFFGGCPRREAWAQQAAAAESASGASAQAPNMNAPPGCGPCGGPAGRARCGVPPGAFSACGRSGGPDATPRAASQPSEAHAAAPRPAAAAAAAASASPNATPRASGVRSEAQLLRDMGFELDESELHALLRQTGGDITSIIAHLCAE